MCLWFKEEEMETMKTLLKVYLLLLIGPPFTLVTLQILFCVQSV